MAVKRADTEDDIRNFFNGVSNRVLRVSSNNAQNVIDRRIQSLQQSVSLLQRDFFKVLAGKMFGVTTAPNLGEYTPMWESLKAPYLKRRQKKKNPGFYIFSGALQRSLSRTHGQTIFGTPTVSYYQAGKSGNVKKYNVGRRDSSFEFQNLRTGTVVPESRVQNIKTVYEIDIYPNIREDVFNSDVPLDEYFSEETAHKLTNFQGKRQRDIMQPYMKWWLDVRVKSLVKQKIRGQ